MPGKTRHRPVPAATSAADYEDFVISASQLNARTVSVAVDASPAGRTAKAREVSFSAVEAEELYRSFYTADGRMNITRAEAILIGKRLARVLFPGEIFPLFAESLATVSRAKRGLRIRLIMDAALLDLPWEYVYRPDREQDGMSGFLLLDPALSMVRHAADPKIRIEPITGRQRLVFAGTLWEGNRDGWEVAREFDELCEALTPVQRYIQPEFMVTGSDNGLVPARLRAAAIFHYAGHCNLDLRGKAFLLREQPTSRGLSPTDGFPLEKLAGLLGNGRTRLVVMAACNSGYSWAVEPLLKAGIPAVIGANGVIDSHSAIEFCAKLYESLAVGLTLDEAVCRARMHLMKWGEEAGFFSWGLFMVHMPSPDATLFPRTAAPRLTSDQQSIRRQHEETIGSTLRAAKELDGMNFGEIMSELSKRRVLILGRFTGRRLKVLERIKTHLARHPNHYIPELFTFSKPDGRDLVESIIGFAALSRFVIADLSEPKSVQSELEAIVPHFQSIPVVPLISRTGKEYATFSSVRRRQNVVQPTVRYRDAEDLMKKLDEEVVPLAERKLTEVRPD